MKTTLRELIKFAKENLNNKGSHTDVANPEALAKLFGFHDIYWDYEQRLEESYYQFWRCTDQKVGAKVYFLEGEEVAISFKRARKVDENIQFLSEEAKDKVLKYLSSLRQEETSDVEILEESELDEEIDDWYSITYAPEVLHKNAWYYNPELGRDEEVEILKKNSNKSFGDYGIKVKFLERNNEMIVNCRDLKFKYKQF